jgi:hypothetical protein
VRILERRASLLLDRMPDADGRGDTDAEEFEEDTDNDDDDDETAGVDEDEDSTSAPLALRESRSSAALTSSRPPTDWLSGPTNASADPWIRPKRTRERYIVKPSWSVARDDMS